MAIPEEKEGKGDIGMTDKEQAISVISRYMDLLRIKAAQDKDTEIENQICETKAQLEALGIVVENLVIK